MESYFRTTDGRKIHLDYLLDTDGIDEILPTLLGNATGQPSHMYPESTTATYAAMLRVLQTDAGLFERFVRIFKHDFLCHVAATDEYTADMAATATRVMAEASGGVLPEYLRYFEDGGGGGG